MPGHVPLEGERVDPSVAEPDDPDRAVLGHVRNNPAFRHRLGFDVPGPENRVEEFVASTAADDSRINPSRRLLDRLGFFHERTAGECRLAGDKSRGRERYGLLEDEWRDEEGTR